MTSKTAVAVRETPKVIALLDDRMNEIAQALPATIPSEKFLRIVKTSIQNNPELLQATPRSVLLSCEKAAADGLVLDGREAALVVYNTKQGDQWVKAAQYMPMYRGLLKMLYNTGRVSNVSAYLVHKREVEEENPRTGRPRFFYVAGDDEHIEHEPIVFGNPGPIVGAYAVIRFKDGQNARAVMDIEEIKRIAARQKKNVNDNGSLKGIWATDFGEMAKKTVLRRLVKLQQLDSDLNRVFEEGDDDYDQRDDEERARDDGKARSGRGPKQAARAASKLNDPEPETIDAEYVEHDAETGEIYDGPEGPGDYDQREDDPDERLARSAARQTRAAPQEARQQPRQAARPQPTRQQAKPAQRQPQPADDGFPEDRGGEDVF